MQGQGMLSNSNIMCQETFMVFVDQGSAVFAFPAPLCLHTCAHAGEVSGVGWRCLAQLQLPLPDWSALGSAHQSSGWVWVIGRSGGSCLFGVQLSQWPHPVNCSPFVSGMKNSGYTAAYALKN